MPDILGVRIFDTLLLPFQMW